MTHILRRIEERVTKAETEVVEEEALQREKKTTITTN